MRTAVALVALAAIFAGCGSGDESGSERSLDRLLARSVKTSCGGAHRSGTADPSVPRLVTESLRAARAERSVRFRVCMTGSVKVDATRIDDAGVPRAQLEALVSHPFRIDLVGSRSDDVLTVTGRVAESGRVHQFHLLQAGGPLLIEREGSWYRFGRAGTIGGLFAMETFAALVPQEACIHLGGEGCDRVDFGPALRKGDLGHLIKGRVRRHEDTTEITGTVDARAFTVFHDDVTPHRRDTRGLYLGALSTFLPYEQNGAIRYVIGRNRLPESFVFSYRLDRDAIEQHLRGCCPSNAVLEREGRIEIDFSHWGEPVRANVPNGVKPMPFGRLKGIYDGLGRAFYIFV